MNDFKFNYYLNLYKDISLPNRDVFRKNFRKKHGKYIHIEELIFAIENYQIKKYGETLSADTMIIIRSKEERDKERVKSYHRFRYKVNG